jgi:hypothetical protein
MSEDLTARPSFFLRAPLMAPRTECGCQPVAFIISAMVAPPLRCRRSTSRASLVPGRREAGDASLFALELLGLAPFDSVDAQIVVHAVAAFATAHAVL